MGRQVVVSNEAQDGVNVKFNDDIGLVPGGTVISEQ